MRNGIPRPARSGAAGPPNSRAASGVCARFAAALAAALAGSAGAQAGPPSVEGRAYSYSDDAGLYVSTVAGAWETPLGAAFTLRLGALADWITILAPSAAAGDAHAGHEGHAGHEEGGEGGVEAGADAISGASARVLAGGGDSREIRAGGDIGLGWHGNLGDSPVTVSGTLRGSGESDYRSVSGILSGRLSLFQANTSLSAFAGFGRDGIDPSRPPPGQSDRWPAAQAKLSGGFGLSQSLTRNLAVSAGLSAAYQGGRLSSPYRNALVGASPATGTYFPESLPAARLRAVAFAGAAVYLGRGAALHLREGFYVDDWGVRAWIPEAALAKESGPWLATLRHRFYAQTRADFYRPLYPDRTGLRTGDARLGRLYDQTGAFRLDYRLGTTASPLHVGGEYLFSRLEYPDLHPRTLYSHVFSLGVRKEY